MRLAETPVRPGMQASAADIPGRLSQPEPQKTGPASPKLVLRNATCWQKSRGPRCSTVCHTSDHLSLCVITKSSSLSEGTGLRSLLPPGWRHWHHLEHPSPQHLQIWLICAGNFVAAAHIAKAARPWPRPAQHKVSQS